MRTVIHSDDNTVMEETCRCKQAAGHVVDEDDVLPVVLQCQTSYGTHMTL